MSSKTTIFESEPRVNIPKSEYDRLLEYEKICKDLLVLFRGEGK